MADETVAQAVRGWLGVIVPAGVGAIAIWQDRIRRWMLRPKLETSVSTNAPDCDLTFLSVQGRFLDEDGQTQVEQGEARCFYFRLRVKNRGKTLAERVEVYVEKVERQQNPLDERYFVDVPNFPPMNLKWSHIGEVTIDLAPEFEKSCDLGYVVAAEGLEKFPKAFQAENRRRAAVNDAHAVFFTFDLQVKPNHGGHVLDVGTYLVHLMIGAANVRPFRKTLKMVFTGQWLESTSMPPDPGQMMVLLSFINPAQKIVHLGSPDLN